VKHNYLFLLLAFLNFNSIQTIFDYEERWDWDSINTYTLAFPQNFIIGTASSAMQTEGIISANGQTTHNSWTAWEAEEIIKDGIIQPRISPTRRVGAACEHWYRYADDFKLAAGLGFRAHRFSIEWSKIEPEKGVFDEAAMQHYIDYTKELIANGIIPIPTLFHHTWPLWFDYLEQNPDEENPRKPAFQDSRNIQDFVDYALFVFKSYQLAGLLDVVKLWLTFNEPVAHALAAFVYSKYPPGKKYKFRLCGQVAKNMLDAHIAVYDALKEIDSSVKISFAHMMQPIQPYYPWNPLDQLPAKIFNYLLNDVALLYFKTGYFNWAWLVREFNPDAINKLDFIGVNYYTHTLLKMFKESERPDEKLSDPYDDKGGKALYAEGLYISLKKAAKLNVPIIITENGFATDTIELKEEYIKKHLYVILKAMDEGIDIRGYLFWTLTDCFGWNSSHHSKHGIFKVDFKTQERVFRASSQYLIDVINNSRFSTTSIEPLTPLL
jgi:beta-glucosidase